MSSSSTATPLCGLDMLRIASEALAGGSPSPSPPPQPPKAPKKRGRKPTPGMTEEDRKRARLLKNRRTAEMSRRRKVAYLETLRSERDAAVAECERLRADNARLRARLQSAELPADGAGTRAQARQAKKIFCSSLVPRAGTPPLAGNLARYLERRPCVPLGGAGRRAELASKHVSSKTLPTDALANGRAAQALLPFILNLADSVSRRLTPNSSYCLATHCHPPPSPPVSRPSPHPPTMPAAAFSLAAPVGAHGRTRTRTRTHALSARCAVRASLSVPTDAPAAPTAPTVAPTPLPVPEAKPPLVRSDAEWRAALAPEVHAVLRQGRTEWPFTSAHLDEQRTGTFSCAGCHAPLFASRTKYSSGTGWPSFWRPLAGALATKESFFDRILGQREASCAHCGGHLGHVFRDGPPPTGERYCINGLALRFVPSDEE